MPRAAVTLAKSSKFVVMASICIVVAALYLAQEVLIPLALSVLLCFLLAPLVTRLERWRFPRPAAVVVVMVVVLALVLVLGWVVVAQVLNLGKNLDQYTENVVQKVQRLPFVHGGAGGMGAKLEKAQEKVVAALAPTSQPATTQSSAAAVTPAARQAAARDQIARGGAPAAVSPESSPQAAPPGATSDHPLWVTQARSKFELLAGYLGAVLSPLGTLGLVVVFAIFMLLAREDMRDRLIRLLGQGDLTITTQALDDAATRISRYLMAQAIVNGTYGVAIGLGLWIIGLTFGHGRMFPSVVVWALLCAVLRFIPYIGPWIASAFPLTIALAAFPGMGVFVAVVLLFVVIELGSNNLMEPWLYGTSTGMSTVAILVSAVFWTWLWGAVGLLLATPLTVCLVVLGKYVPQLRFLDILLGDEPVLDPPTRVYQRMLALDQEEAQELVSEYFKDRTLLQVYDEVLLPALAMAEQDRHKGKLDDERQAFIRGAMGDLIDDLGDEQRAREAAQEAARQKAAADVTAEAARTGTMAARDVAASSLPATASSSTPATASATTAVSSPASVLAKLVTGNNGNAKEEGGAPTTAPRPPATAEARLPQGCTVNIVTLPARDPADELAGRMLTQLLAFRGYCAYAASVEKLAAEMVESVAKRNAHVVCVSALPPAAVTYSRYLCKRLHQRFPEQNMVVGLWTTKADLKRAKERIACEESVQLVTSLAGALEQIHQLVQPVIVAESATSAAGSAAR